VDAGISDELLRALAIGWYFGSVAMVVFGVIILLCWRATKTGAASVRAITGSIALAYVAFGSLAFFADSFNPHFIIAFVLPGLMLGVSVVAGIWES
jgi:hypothetical protein